MKFGKDDVVVPVLVWTKENYERTKIIFDDEMPETFADWQKRYSETLSALPVNTHIVPIKADPDDVAEWCREQALDVVAENRARYAAERFRREHGV